MSGFFLANGHGVPEGDECARKQSAESTVGSQATAKDFVFAEMRPAIEVIGLTKYFSPKKAALEDINFTLFPGELCGVLGPNGAGKTTLLKILAGLILPSKGKVLINGYDIEKEGIRVRALVGLVSGEERSFYWRLSGRQNLEFFARLYGLNGRELQHRIEEVLTAFKIDEPDKRVDKYSTGMRHRLGLARGLIHNPPILLMDEPTKSIDPVSAEDLRNFILKELIEKQKKAALFTTHRLEEVDNFAQRLLLIKRGKILAEMQKEEPKNRDIILRLLKDNAGD